MNTIAAQRPASDLAALLAMMAVIGGLALAAGIGYWSPPALGAASDTSPLSTLGALRQFKGAVWAALAIALAHRLQRRAMPTLEPIALGIVLGLAGTVAWVLWERAAFVGLLDIRSDYRVSGPFSVMNIGGAYIECYLTLATPWLVWQIVRARHLSNRLLGLALLLATAYALAVTFSRTGYLAFALVLGTMLLGAALNRPGRARLGLAATAALTGALALPVALGPYAMSRLKATGQDFATRQQHWQDSQALMDQHSPWWGAGLARYPADHYSQHFLGRHSATFDRLTEGDGPLLRLAGGDTVYVEQSVAVRPRQELLLRLQARAVVANAEFNTSLCEKWMLSSFECVGHTFRLDGAAGAWHRLEWRLNTGRVADQPWFARRPAKFALHTPPGAYTVDLRRISLVDAGGHELLANGGFADDMDHWYFSVGNHLQWHTKNLYLHVRYEQGWLGALLWASAAVLAAWRALGAVRQHRLLGWLGLSSLLAWLVLGAFDSLIDTPRFLMLALLTLALCAGTGARSAPEPEVSRHG